jgi:hypothetical protein
VMPESSLLMCFVPSVLPGAAARPLLACVCARETLATLAEIAKTPVLQVYLDTRGFSQTLDRPSR